MPLCAVVSLSCRGQGVSVVGVSWFLELALLVVASQSIKLRSWKGDKMFRRSSLGAVGRGRKPPPGTNCQDPCADMGVRTSSSSIVGNPLGDIADLTLAPIRQL